MNERIHKYFYEKLSTEERLSLLRDVEASEELKKEFVEYQNLYALLNLGHQVQDKTIGKQKYDCFILQKQHSVMWKRWTRRIGYAAAICCMGKCLLCQLPGFECAGHLSSQSLA